ncbi:hypothetical protein MKX01_008825 [Papaver californicum]|nr:hypothetical protein MKX01_008825 [Papaver californicum]
MKFSGMSSQTKPEESIHKSAPLISNFNDRIRPMLDAVDKLRQGICTRVPLIMRLQNHSSSTPKLHLEFQGKKVDTDEASISEAISYATDEIAGDGKCISNTPLTLVVNKKGVSDLTMVDLPWITRVLINDIIMEYIKPKESIILNVLSATVDFPTCESIRMSQKVDKTGERTLAVVTKVDKSPEGLLEKVTADDVNIGLGYVCVRNCIGDETYEEARIEEARLFHSHPLLSKIDKSIVGVPVLAQKLVRIQATSISNCLPDIVKKINEKLNQNAAELNNMPKNLTSIADAVSTLRKILITGEFNEFPDEGNMHCTARLSEMLDSYAADLESKSPWNNNKDSFLTEEVKVLGETKGIALPNFLPRAAFLTILQRRVEVIAETPIEFAQKVWSYVEDVFVRALVMKSESYPQLQSFTRWAAHNVMTKVRNNSIERVKEIDTQIVQQAFDIKMRLTAYWKIILRRLVDSLALHLIWSKTSELMGGPIGCGGIERMLEESPSVATKRDKLNRSIKLLRDSKDVVAKIIDRIPINGEGSN